MSVVEEPTVPLKKDTSASEKPLQLAPRFIQPLQDTRITEDQPLELSCSVDGLPMPQVTWYRGAKPLRDSPDVRLLHDGDK